MIVGEGEGRSGRAPAALNGSGNSGGGEGGGGGRRRLAVPLSSKEFVRVEGLVEVREVGGGRFCGNGGGWGAANVAGGGRRGREC